MTTTLEQDNEEMSLAKSIDIPEPIISSGPNTSTMFTNEAGVSHQSDLTERSLIALLSQKKLYAVQNISVGQSVGLLYVLIDYNHNFVALTHFRTFSSAYTFYRGFRADLEITVEVTSMMQHQGALICTQTNAPYSLDMLSHSRENESIAAMYPRRFITLGHCGTYKFLLPWESNLDFWPTKPIDADLSVQGTTGRMNEYYSNGRFEIRLFDPMRAVENATMPATIRVWTELKNLKFKVYSPTNPEQG